MVKKSGPDLNITPATVKWCSECRSRSVIKPMLHELSCPTCTGLAVVDKETGEILETIPAVMALVQVIKKQRLTIESLKKNELHSPYGDLPTRHGGKHRMD